MNHIETYNRARQSTALPTYPWTRIVKAMPKEEQVTADMIAKTYARTLSNQTIRTARIEVTFLILAINAAILLSLWGLA